MIAAEEISWDEAVLRYCEDPVTSKRKGYLGILKRTQVERYEEPFLRAAFQDLGVRKIESPVLRGPIEGDIWLYLLRIEFVSTRGVVELQAVKPRVDRSLREDLLRTELEKLTSGVKRTIRLP